MEPLTQVRQSTDVGRIGRWVRRWPVATVAAAAILLHLALRTNWVAGSYFYEDDFALIERSFGHPLSWSLLTQSDGGHLSPGRAAVFWLTTMIGPYDRWPVVLVTVALHAVAAVLFWLLLRRLFGATVGALVPLTLYLFWAMTTTTTVWWCAALLWLPLHIALIGALLLQVRYLQTGRLRYALLAAVPTVFGLLFFEKALIIPVVLFAFTMLYGVEGSLWRRFWDTVRTPWQGWLLYVGLGVGYLAAYFSLSTVGSLAGTPTADDVLTLARGMVLKSFATEVWGGPWVWYGDVLTKSFAAPPAAAVWVACAGVLAVLVLSSLTGLRSWRAWTLLAGYLLFGLVLMAAARLQGDGFAGLIGLLDRYLSDVAVMAAFAIGLAFLPTRGLSPARRHALPPALDARPAAEPEPAIAAESPADAEPVDAPASADQPQSATLRRWLAQHPAGQFAVAAVVVAVAISSVFSAADLQSKGAGTPTEKYFRTLFADLERHPDTELFDAPVPLAIVHPIVHPANMLSKLVRPTSNPPWFPTWSHQFSVVDDAGRLRPGTVTDVVHSPPVAPNTCPWVAKGNKAGRPATDATIPLGSKATQSPWIVRLAYISSVETPAVVTLGEAQVQVQLRTGLNEVFVALTGEGESVQVGGLVRDASVCFASAVLGLPTARS